MLAFADILKRAVCILNACLCDMPAVSVLRLNMNMPATMNSVEHNSVCARTVLHATAIANAGEQRSMNSQMIAGRLDSKLLTD